LGETLRDPQRHFRHGKDADRPRTRASTRWTRTWNIPAEVATLPVDDETNVYFAITDGRRQRGRFNIKLAQAPAFEQAERGSSVKFPVQLPDGREVIFRLNNIDLATGGRRLVLFADAAGREWLQNATVAGQVLHLQMTPGAGAHAHLIDDGRVSAAAQARHEVVPVRADWNDTRGLLGYWNPLTNRYERTPFLDLALRALKDTERPYFAILDEMNLARVEYYFSDVLSAMESGAPILLRGVGDDDDESDEEVPISLSWPRNLYIIGTVNVDETTHAFSPKVLDRASVIEFDEVDIGRALGGGDESIGDPFKLSNPLINVSMFAPREGLSVDAIREQFADFNPHLAELHAVLAKDRLHFGYRVINEIVSFVGLAIQHAGPDSAPPALDRAFCQKVLPKLSGGREIEVPLRRVLSFMLEPNEAGGDRYRDALERWSGAGADGSAYPRSAAKTARMIQRLVDTGFVSALE
jgi:hypothetical protein